MTPPTDPTHTHIHTRNRTHHQTQTQTHTHTHTPLHTPTCFLSHAHLLICSTSGKVSSILAEVLGPTACSDRSGQGR